MSTLGEVRNELVMLKGKSASGITHGLKVLDGGESTSLIDNIINVLDRMDANCQREISKSRRDTLIVCAMVSGTALIGSIYLWTRNRKMQKLNEENRERIKELKDEIKVKYSTKRNAPIETDMDNSDDSERQACVISGYNRGNYAD